MKGELIRCNRFLWLFILLSCEFDDFLLLCFVILLSQCFSVCSSNFPKRNDIFVTFSTQIQTVTTNMTVRNSSPSFFQHKKTNSVFPFHPLSLFPLPIPFPFFCIAYILENIKSTGSSVTLSFFLLR